jgi:hypothetical protein
MRRILRVTVLVAGSLGLLSAAVHARTIVCVDGGNDEYVSMIEGYYRSLLAPPDDIQVGTNLTDCLAKAADGDRIIIVAHGVRTNGVAGGGFHWAGTNYSGFGFGTGVPGMTPFPIPAGLRSRRNLTITIVSCWSSLDPDGAGGQVSVTLSLFVGLLAGQGNTVDGFNGLAQPGYGFAWRNGSAAQQQAATTLLQTNRTWQANPPSNRPGANPNQQTAAQALVDQMFPTKGMQVRIRYFAPAEVPGAPQFMGSVPKWRIEAQELCSPIPQLISSGPEEQLPGVPAWGQIFLAALLAITCTLVLRKRALEA